MKQQQSRPIRIKVDLKEQCPSCLHHHNREDICICSMCDDAVCRFCVVLIDGNLLCVACADQHGGQK